jgi:hypothetical protein
MYQRRRRALSITQRALSITQRCISVASQAGKLTWRPGPSSANTDSAACTRTPHNILSQPGSCVSNKTHGVSGAGAAARQMAVFQSTAREPSPVYPAGRVGTSADPNIPPGGLPS